MQKLNNFVLYAYLNVEWGLLSSGFYLLPFLSIKVLYSEYENLYLARGIKQDLSNFDFFIGDTDCHA